MSKMGKMMGGGKAKGDQRSARELLPSVDPTGEIAPVKTNSDVIPLAVDTKRRRQGSVALGL